MQYEPSYKSAWFSLRLGPHLLPGNYAGGKEQIQQDGKLCQEIKEAGCGVVLPNPSSWRLRQEDHKFEACKTEEKTER
jgi:hypothetical protein